MFSRRLVPLAAALVFSTGAHSQEGASWLRTRAAANALNPNISLVGDLVGSAGPRPDSRTNRFGVRETEINLQAAVDPFARGDFSLALHEGESLELEEGYVTLLALPWGLQARGGKFLAGFGRLNIVHGHELPQADRPYVLEAFLGEEGLNDTGMELSRFFAPFGVYTELSYGMLNGLGGDHGHEDGGERTVFVQALDQNGVPLTDSGGNPVFRRVALDEEEEETPRTIRNFAHVARLRFYRDLTESANAEFGVSGALHEPETGEQRRLVGVDLTFRWKPLRMGRYKSFIWRTEGLVSTRMLEEEMDVSGNVTAPERRLNRRGGYTYLEYQPGRRWRFGVRGDYSEDPEQKGEVFSLKDGSSRRVERSVTRGVSPYATFTLTEFNRLRLQYTRKRVPDGQEEHRAFLQWTVLMGPHGAHPF